MNKSQSWTSGKIVYAVLMSGLLLGYLAVIAFYKDPTITGETFHFPIYVWILRIITAGMAIRLGELWKDKTFLILAAYLLLKLVRVAIPDMNNLFTEPVSDTLLTGLWVFTACYGLPRILSKEQLKRFLAVNGSVWTIGMVIYSMLGICAAWTDQWIWTIGKGSGWGIFTDKRLYLVYYVTSSGSILSISAVMALCGAVLAKRKTNKLLFILAMLPIILALSLTDSRCAQVTLGVGMAAVTGLYLLNKLQHQKKSVQWLIALVAAAAVLVIVVISTMKSISLFNQLKVKGLVISHAQAEETAGTILSNRGFIGDDPLNQRPATWNAVLNVLQANPGYLLCGTSILNPMEPVNASPWVTLQVAHTHCMPLMILLENGIPGLLLMGVFRTLIAKRTIPQIKKTGFTLEKAAIAAALSIMAGELIECFTWLHSGQIPTMPFFFITLGILAKDTISTAN